MDYFIFIQDREAKAEPLIRKDEREKILEHITINLRFGRDAITGDLIEGQYDSFWQALKDNK